MVLTDKDKEILSQILTSESDGGDEEIAKNRYVMPLLRQAGWDPKEDDDWAFANSKNEYLSKNTMEDIKLTIVNSISEQAGPIRELVEDENKRPANYDTFKKLVGDLTPGARHANADWLEYFITFDDQDNMDLYPSDAEGGRRRRRRRKSRKSRKGRKSRKSRRKGKKSRRKGKKARRRTRRRRRR